MNVPWALEERVCFAAADGVAHRRPLGPAGGWPRSGTSVLPDVLSPGPISHSAGSVDGHGLHGDFPLSSARRPSCPGKRSCWRARSEWGLWCCVQPPVTGGGLTGGHLSDASVRLLTRHLHPFSREVRISLFKRGLVQTGQLGFAF